MKKAKIISVLLIGTALLTACGSSDSSSKTADSTASSTAAAESQAEAAAGAQGPGSAAAPWVGPLGPKSEPPTFTRPSWGRRGPPVGPAPRVQAPSCLPILGLSETACRTEGLAGPEVRGWTLGLEGMWGSGGHSVTPEPALGPTDRQTDGLGMPGCFPLARRLGALPRGALPPPAPCPPPSPPPGAGGGGQ